MWILRRLKKLGAEEQELIDTYIQQIRSITEMACPVWNAGITQQESRSLEKIQKTALAIIREDSHTGYHDALIHFGIETLKDGRERLSLKFAIKAYSNPKFSSWFPVNTPLVSTRSEKIPLKAIVTRTRWYKKSPIPNLTDLLNCHSYQRKTKKRKK